MPIYNGINTDALEEFARRFLGIRQGGIMPSLSPEPSVAVNYPTMPDQLALAGYIPFGAAASIAAGGAGTFGAVNVRNTSPGSIITVRITVTNNTAACAFLCGVGTTALGLAALGISNAAWTDLRRLPTSFPMPGAIAIETGTLAAIPPAGYNNVGGYALPTGVPFSSPVAVLPPNGALALWMGNANQGLFWQVDGYIRDALPDELTSV